MMRRTVARPTPVPSNSAAECSRWNAPNSLSAYFMSKPAPLSRTMNARSPFPSTDPNSTRGCACLAVYFQLFRSRFSRTTRSRRESPRASSPWAIANSTRRSGVVRRSSAAISRAMLLKLRGIVLQLTLALSQGAVLVLDAAEHLIEGVRQCTQFVVAELRRAHGVVVANGDRLGGLRQRENGLRDPSLKDRGQEIGRQQGDPHNARGNGGRKA